MEQFFLFKAQEQDKKIRDLVEMQKVKIKIIEALLIAKIKNQRENMRKANKRYREKVKNAKNRFRFMGR